MFLSIITLLQSKLPCATNFFRYKTNYEDATSLTNGSPMTEATIRQIASPQLMAKLSPVKQFVANQGFKPAQSPLKQAKTGVARKSLK